LCTPVQVRSAIWSCCELESAQAKNQALREAGAVVPTSYEAFETAIKETFEKLVEEGKIAPVPEVEPPQIPEDLKSAIKSGKVRAPTHIISTISDDRGLINEFGLHFPYKLHLLMPNNFLILMSMYR
ncbi:hypothetical protein BHE74_00024608, partial [Ensete ventricosum]